MDAVRFGRALGFGARQAVKTVAAVVDAATADNPSHKGERARTNASAAQPGGIASGQGSSANSAAGGPQVLSPGQPQILSPERARRAQPAQRTQAMARKPAKRQARGVRRGLRHFVDATLEPAVRLGGVLWLEFTGVFFGIFAAFAVSGVWKWRAAWRLSATNPHEHWGLVGSMAMAGVFGYFCVSSFVRARRRERGQ